MAQNYSAVRLRRKPAPAPEPAPEPAPAPQELPKTASPYPLIGLAGLLLARSVRAICAAYRLS